MTPDLMIFYEAPPRLSSGAILAAKELKALAGVLPAKPVIDLVCASAVGEVPADPTMESLMPDYIRVHRIDPFPKGRKTLLQRIVGGLGGWQQAAINKSAALFPAEHKKPALLYSRSHPPASHLAALELLEGPLQGVPWVAQFTEPWSQNPYYKSPMTRAALRRFEQRIFEGASRFVFVSEAMRDTMLTNTGDEIRAKARIIPPVCDPSLYGIAPLPATYPPAQPGVVSVAHVGSLTGLRSPAPLLVGLARMNELYPDLAPRIAVNLIGRVEEFDATVERTGVGAQVRHIESIPYTACLSALQAADVLLAIESPAANSVFFSAKFVDYLGARKPILAITAKDSYAARLMDEWKQQWCDVTDVEAIARALKGVASGELWAPPAPEFIDGYLPRRAGELLAACLSEVRQDRPELENPGGEEERGVN